MIVLVLVDEKYRRCEGGNVEDIQNYLLNYYRIKTVNLFDIASGEIAQNPLSGNPLRINNKYLKTCHYCKNDTLTNKKWCQTCRCDYACNILVNEPDSNTRVHYYKYPKINDFGEYHMLMECIDAARGY